MRIAILRFENLPGFVTWEIPDVDIYFEEDRMVIREFESRGHNASHVIWSDKTIDWNEFDIAIIRSTWDYIDRPEEFLNVLSTIERSSCKLFNPFDAVRWNIDKQYLFDLHQMGVPIIPTYELTHDDLDCIRENMVAHI